MDSIKPGLMRSILCATGLTAIADFDKTDGFRWLKIVPWFYLFLSKFSSSLSLKKAFYFVGFFFAAVDGFPEKFRWFICPSAVTPPTSSNFTTCRTTGLLAGAAMPPINDLLIIISAASSLIVFCFSSGGCDTSFALLLSEILETTFESLIVGTAVAAFLATGSSEGWELASKWLSGRA